MGEPGCRLGPCLVRVAEASPGAGLTEHLAVSAIEVPLRTVPRSDDEIRQERPDRNRQAACSRCPLNGHEELAA